MDAAAAVTVLLLSLVFLVAGAFKLRARDETRRMLVQFGAPPKLANPTAIVLPVAELATGMLLPVPRLTQAAALLGAMLLIIFAIAVAANLAKGRKPECRCFGQLHPRPVSPATILRNALLATAALFVALHGPVRWQSNRADVLALVATGSFIFPTLLVLFCAIGVLAWFYLQLLRQNGRILARLEALELEMYARAGHGSSPDAGLPVGSRAPDFDLPRDDGRRTSLGDLLAPTKPLLLIFADPDCSPCRKLVSESARWQTQHGDLVTIALISRGTPEANRALKRDAGPGPLLLQQNFEVADAYKCPRTPGAVLIEPAGRIASPVAIGAHAIQALLRNSVGATPVAVK